MRVASEKKLAVSWRRRRTRRVCGLAMASWTRTHVVATTQVDRSVNPRVSSLRASRTMALTDLARAMQADGIDVVGLAAGEPDFDTPHVVAEAGVRAIRSGKTRYAPNRGTAELQARICTKLKRDHGLEYAHDEIVVSNGAKQSCAMAVFACCQPGDEVIVPAPYWVSYPEMATLAGANSVVLHTKPRDGFVLQPDALAQSLTEKSRMLVLCTPSNPTGAVYTEQQLKDIAQVVAEHPRLLVLSDEIYEHIVYPPAKHRSFASLDGMWERTITVNGFSKGYAMTGWRLGYAAAPRWIANAMAAVQSHTTSGANTIAQEAALEALELGPGGGEPGMAMIQAFQERRDYVVKRLRAIEGIVLAEPQGAFYAFPDVSQFLGPDVEVKGFGKVPDVDALCRYILEVAKVAVVPGDAFGDPNCLRISYAASMELLEKAMDRIGSALQLDKFERRKPNAA